MPHNVEEDFLQAYQRLLMAVPRVPKLQALITAGKNVPINQFNVALEAGRSRTLISTRAPGYERICALLYPDERRGIPPETAKTNKNGETSKEKIARLNFLVEQAERERDQYATRLSETYIALTLKGEEIATLRARLQRRERNKLEPDDFSPSM